MQTRYIITTAIVIIGGPLLFMSQIEPEAAGTSSAGEAATVFVAPVPGAVSDIAGGASVTTMAGAEIAVIEPGSVRASPMGADTAAPIDTVATLLPLADASASDLASAGLGTRVVDFAAFFAATAGNGASGGAFDRLSVRDDNAFLLAGGGGLDGLSGRAIGVGGGGIGAVDSDPEAFAASGQAQMVSSVPEPASWISFIVGFGLIGLNMRRRPRLRSVSA
jgi:hypothetical protein